MGMEERINWIEGTPLGLTLREIERTDPHLHEDVIELTLCLSGEIKMSFIFEEFTLRAGDFILVDMDTHYLYDGKDAVCASFYIRREDFEKKYPYIKSVFLVCEGTPDSSVPYDTPNHKRIKGILLAVLLYLIDEENGRDCTGTLVRAAEEIVDILVNKFDIVYFYHPDLEISEKNYKRHQLMMDYMYRNYTEDLSVKDIAEAFSVSEAYVTELFAKYSLGFRRILSFVRMCKAEKLLLYTDMSILQISAACNFSDQKYLYQTFKYWYGYTPSQFKNQYFKGIRNMDIEKIVDVRDVAGYVEKLTREHFKDTFL